MAQISYYVENTIYSWRTTSYLNYTTSYNSITNQTTVTFQSCDQSYWGTANYGTSVKTNITVTAVDNTSNVETSYFEIWGHTNGSSVQMMGVPSPASVVVTHSSTSGAKQVKIDVSTEIFAAMSGATQKTAKGSGTATVTSGTHYPERTLSISAENATVTCQRTSSPAGAGTGTLTNGATIYDNDVLKFTFTPATNYTIKTRTVNGTTFTSGNSHTVSGNVTVVVVAEPSIFTLSLNYDSGVNLTVKRNGTTLANGAVLNKGEVLTVTYSLKDDSTTSIQEATLNGSTISSGATHTVSGSVIVRVYSQTKQTQCMIYQAKVYNGSSWANLGLVEFYDSKWKTYGYLGDESGIYTNALNRAVDTSGNVIGRTWWKTNKRFNSSSGDPIDNTGTMITGLIPFSTSDKIRIRWSGNSSATFQQLKFYKYDLTQCNKGYLSFYNLNANNSTKYTVDQYNLAGGKVDFTVLDTTYAIHKDAAYFAVVLVESDINNVVITINEEID